MHSLIQTKRFKYIVWAAVVILLMGGVYWYTHSRTTARRAAPSAPAVMAETLVRKDMEKRVVLSGKTVPKAEVAVSPKYGGRLASVEVDLGSVVAAGDVLARQDTKDLDIAILQNQAGSDEAAASAVESRAQYGGDTTKAQSDYDNALASYERYQSLYDEGAVSLQDRDDKYRAMMEARAALESLENQQIGTDPAVVVSKEAAAEKARRAVEALAQQREDMTIRAPSAGVIGYRKAEAGEWVTAGQKILSIVDNSEVYVDADVAEQDIGVLQEGMPLSVSIDSLGETREGRISYISPSMDSDTRSYKVRIVLDNGEGRLLGGMFARTEVTALQRKDTLFVPKEAVGDDNGKKYIFLLDEEGKARKSYVTIGLSNDESMEILRGAAPGDRAAVTNISRLRDGMTVEITEAPGGKE